MFKNIPQQRLFLYLMLAGLVPVIIAWFGFSAQLDTVSLLEKRLWSVQEYGSDSSL